MQYYTSPASSGLTEEQRRNEDIAQRARFGLPAQAPTATPTAPEPTVSQTYKDFASPQTDAAYDTALDEMGNYYRQQAQQPISQDKIYRDTLKQYQAQIDATNRIYQDQLRQAQVEGMGRLGSQRAISARSGTLGSDFGAAQEENVRGYNRDIEREINNELNAKIAQIMGMARSQSAEEINARRKAKQEGAESYLQYLAGKTERRRSGISSLASAMIAQGINPDEIDPVQLKQIAQQYGASEDDIRAAFFEANQAAQAQAAESDLKTRKTEAEIAKINADIAQGKYITIGEGTMLRNLETGETIKNPKTYAPTGGGAGAVTDISPLGVEQSPFIDQTNYARLNAKQRSQADSLNNLVRSLNEYKKEFDATTGKAGVNLFGADSGVLQTKLNSIIFAAAQAEGTGALQQADREVIEQIIPNPTNIKGAFNALTKGGKSGALAKIQDQIDKYSANLKNLGLSPTNTATGTNIRAEVEAAGYDYDAMKADGLSDDEILESL